MRVARRRADVPVADAVRVILATADDRGVSDATNRQLAAASERLGTPVHEGNWGKRLVLMAERGLVAVTRGAAGQGRVVRVLPAGAALVAAAASGAPVEPAPVPAARPAAPPSVGPVAVDPLNRKVQAGTAAGRGYLPARREERPPVGPAPRCRWIEGDPRAITTLGEAIYCGQASLSGSSYCPQHHARCWRPGGEVPETEAQVRAAHWVVVKRRAA